MLNNYQRFKPETLSLRRYKEHGGRTRGRTHWSLHGGSGATVSLLRRSNPFKQCVVEGED
jgi:hypothetical protein